MVVEVYPSFSVAAGMKGKAVFGICRKYGYFWDDETSTQVYTGFDIDTATWTDQAAYDAAEAFFNEMLTTGADGRDNPLKTIYLDQINQARVANVVAGEF